MRNYRNAIVALTLALLLLTTAHAGDGVMHTGIVAPTPTPTPISLRLIDAPEAGAQIAESDPAAATGILTEVTLDLLRSVLTLF